MTIHEYLEEHILILTVSSIVEQFQVVTRREMETDGYLRVRATLIDEGLLEASIYCQLVGGTVHQVDYRFHWQDKAGNLKMRWDNARHHLELRTFPHHVHVGKEGNVKESESMDFGGALRVIESEMESSRSSDAINDQVS